MTVENHVEALVTLRLELAAKRAHLRGLQRVERVKQAQAEKRALERECSGDSKLAGTNEAERARNLTLWLADDLDWMNFGIRLALAQEEVEDLQAEIDGLIDERRERERQTRDHLADALLGLQIAPKVSPQVADGITAELEEGEPA